MISRPSSVRRSQRTFWQLYLYHVLVIVAVVATILGVTQLLPRQTMPLERMSGNVVRELKKQGASLEALRARVRELHAIVGARFAVYSLDGALLASAGSPVPQPLPSAKARGVAGSSGVVPTASGLGADLGMVSGRRAYLLIALPLPPIALPLSTAVGTIFVILGVLSWVSTRAVTRPLDRLSQTARQLAQGDLSARTGMVRRDELGDLARSLDQMAATLERHMRREKELLANISHEIRTPLARIRVALEICEEKEGDVASLKADLAAMTKDVVELEQLLQDAFAVTRLDLADKRDPLMLHRERVQLAAVVTEAAAQFASVHPECQMILDVPTDLPFIEIAPALIRRVLQNMLENAAKYSPAEKPIEIAVRPGAREVTVEVRDSGPGIHSEELSSVFEPFFRGEASRTRRSGGTGLGLTLCHRIVTAHGGTISVANRNQGGAIFRFSLPLA